MAGIRVPAIGEGIPPRAGVSELSPVDIKIIPYLMTFVLRKFSPAYLRVETDPASRFRQVCKDQVERSGSAPIREERKRRARGG